MQDQDRRPEFPFPVLQPSLELVGDTGVDERLSIFKEVRLAMPRADVWDVIRAAEWILYGPEEERENDGQSRSTAE